MTRVRLRSAAVDDVRDIGIFSKARFGAVAARAYLAGLDRHFGLIERRPMAGRPEDAVRPGLRSLGYRSHRIYYVVTEHVIDIVRILHQARDAEQELAGE